MEPQQRIALCLPVYKTGSCLSLRRGKWRIWRVLPPLHLARQARTDAVQTHIRGGASGQTRTGGVSYVGVLQAPGIAATRLTQCEMVDRHGFAPCSPACEASDLLNDRAAQKVARRLGAAPSPRGFGDQAALLAPAVLKKMVRSAGLAPASPDWHSGILLLNDERE